MDFHGSGTEWWINGEVSERRIVPCFPLELSVGVKGMRERYTYWGKVATWISY